LDALRFPAAFRAVADRFEVALERLKSGMLARR
jgi:hypothetical protein